MLKKPLPRQVQILYFQMIISFFNILFARQFAGFCSGDAAVHLPGSDRGRLCCGHVLRSKVTSHMCWTVGITRNVRVQLKRMNWKGVIYLKAKLRVEYLNERTEVGDSWNKRTESGDILWKINLAHCCPLHIYYLF